MSGLRKTSMINCLSNLLILKGIEFNVKEINELSTSQLRHKINEVRGHKRKGGGIL
mgnify:CR=1 FL=1